MAELVVRYNDKVKLLDGAQGAIKFVGQVVGKDGIFYGIDLVKGTGKNNGTAGGQIYFKTKGGKKSGKFVKLAQIKKTSKTEHSVEFTVGDAVAVKSKGNGIVRFVGVPAFSKVSKPMYGVELDDPKGICDGTMKGCTYFTCSAKHGVYVEQNKVTAGTSKQTGKAKETDNEDQKEQAEEKPKKKKKKKDPEPEPEPEVEEDDGPEDSSEEPEQPVEQEQQVAEEPEPEQDAQVDDAEEEDVQEQQEEDDDAEPEQQEEPEQEEPVEEVAAVEDDNKDSENENETQEAEEENLDKIGDITEDAVVEYLREHYAANEAVLTSPHDIAKKIMESQGVNETQFQFHLNKVGRITYWIVNAVPVAFGSDCEVPGQGFKITVT